MSWSEVDIKGEFEGKTWDNENYLGEKKSDIMYGTEWAFWK